MESKFWGSLIIFVFAGSMVALGANELHKRAEVDSQRIDMQQVVNDIYGDSLYESLLSDDALAQARERSANRQKSAQNLLNRIKRVAGGE